MNKHETELDWRRIIDETKSANKTNCKTRIFHSISTRNYCKFCLKFRIKFCLKFPNTISNRNATEKLEKLEKLEKINTNIYIQLQFLKLIILETNYS